jgi:hypothetical protein
MHLAFTRRYSHINFIHDVPKHVLVVYNCCADGCNVLFPTGVSIVWDTSALAGSMDGLLFGYSVNAYIYSHLSSNVTALDAVGPGATGATLWTTVLGTGISISHAALSRVNGDLYACTSKSPSSSLRSACCAVGAL